jgi:hypothetical protein
MKRKSLCIHNATASIALRASCGAGQRPFEQWFRHAFCFQEFDEHRWQQVLAEIE